MSNIFGILNMGSGALQAQQKAVDVIGHNIANVNTSGFTRQRVNLQTNVPISGRPGQLETVLKQRKFKGFMTDI